MKKLVFILAVLFSITGNGQNSELFEAANQAYAAENYEEAAQKYEQILENGETSAAVHYNLGNSYYRLNEIAPSIYHYEKALLLDPNDEDVRNNLAFARNMAIDALGEQEAEGFWGFLDRSTGVFSASGWGWVAVFCMLIFVIFFLMYYFSNRSSLKRILFISSIFFIFLAIFSAAIGFAKENLRQESNYAIVFAEEAQVKSEPSVRSEEVFILHEGAKVKITENFQDWVEIELPNGSQGWMEQSSLKRL